ncbi:hypothetical protein DLM75_23830 [Leptospira stimsonii]|uniref:Lipoprotein n=1 Tax=Leptospira stimsonii TaxID=2202203 RepID=A0A396YQ36_9LEPT|nr:hypothetical protein DLM75_23830 [Leptospira stimsonii]
MKYALFVIVLFVFGLGCKVMDDDSTQSCKQSFYMDLVLFDQFQDPVFLVFALADSECFKSDRKVKL